MFDLPFLRGRNVLISTKIPVYLLDPASDYFMITLLYIILVVLLLYYIALLARYLLLVYTTG